MHNQQNSCDSKRRGQGERVRVALQHEGLADDLYGGSNELRSHGSDKVANCICRYDCGRFRKPKVMTSSAHGHAGSCHLNSAEVECPGKDVP
ncbi:hypothetical protein GOP47_0022998 [Adiantum capillus-veneris]|uniref:Uncharacterized protein n=1 Tax=Adiantum capillus-veneris TaxID=13818 RepID=A0A9D4U8E8_ADICA|nr:hypothetical protein GOP47_0022998 [Adiantum capillus-veneris]